jgi:hypothetical protein
VVEPKAFQDALLAYHARPCDAEAEAVRTAVLQGVAPSADTDLLRQALERLEWWENVYGDPEDDPPDAVIAALRARLAGVQESA